MEIYYFDQLPSTQRYLIDALKQGHKIPPVCVVAKEQTEGIGSRGNSWEYVSQALTFSFAISRDSLPHDLPLQSSSIYFGYLFKQCLKQRGSKVWLKWPNDLYVGDKKVGGVMVNLLSECVVCGIGVNGVTHQRYGGLEEDVQKEGMIEEYVQSDFFKLEWKQIFSKYALEFQSSKGYSFHYGKRLIPMERLTLLEDGSLSYEGEIFFSER